MCVLLKYAQFTTWIYLYLKSYAPETEQVCIFWKS